MNKESIFINFEKLLINYYKDLNLNEKEVVVLQLINLCIEGGTNYVPPEILILKMRIRMEELQEIYVSLMNKQYILQLVDSSNHFTTSLDKLKSELVNFFVGQEKAKQVRNPKIFELVEKEFNRSFSPFEIDIIRSWIDIGFTKEQIEKALIDANDGKLKTIRKIDKILRDYRVAQEVKEEGGTTISEAWNKDISETTKIATKTWLDDEE
jgi:DNA replication protein